MSVESTNAFDEIISKINAEMEITQKKSDEATYQLDCLKYDNQSIGLGNALKIIFNVYKKYGGKMTT